MTASYSPFLAISIPHLELLIICGFAASLPALFMIWLHGWLDAAKDEDPDDVVRAQAEADKEHLEHQHPEGPHASHTDPGSPAGAGPHHAHA